MSQRKSISVSQKAVLHAHKHLYSSATQKQLCEWFKATYDHILFSGLISDILFLKYSHLDSDSLPSWDCCDSQDSKHQHHEHWSELEEALFEWILCVEEQIPISAEVIRQKAQFFWGGIYPEKEMPTFSNDWLHNCYGFVREPFVGYSAEASSTLGGEDYTQIFCTSGMYLDFLFFLSSVWDTQLYNDLLIETIWVVP